MNRREPKTKPAKPKDRGGLRQRKGGGRGGDGDDELAGWSSALDPELYSAKERTRKGLERKRQKKSGRNRAEERFEDLDAEAEGGESSVGRAGALASGHMPESLFVSWEELLESREDLKRRMDTIAAVHGWEGASTRKGFLGGVEPSALLDSIQAETAALKPVSEALDSTGRLLELEALREQLRAADEERDRLEEDLQQSREEYFQARDQLQGQTAQLETLRQEAEEATAAHDKRSDSKSGGDRTGPELRRGRDFGGAGLPSDSDPLAAFKVTLSRHQVASLFL